MSSTYAAAPERSIFAANAEGNFHRDPNAFEAGRSTPCNKRRHSLNFQALITHDLLLGGSLTLLPSGYELTWKEDWRLRRRKRVFFSFDVAGFLISFLFLRKYAVRCRLLAPLISLLTANLTALSRTSSNVRFFSRLVARVRTPPRGTGTPEFRFHEAGKIVFLSGTISLASRAKFYRKHIRGSSLGKTVCSND